MKTEADINLTFTGGHLVCYVTINENKSPCYDREVQDSVLSAVCLKICYSYSSFTQMRQFPPIRIIFQRSIFIRLPSSLLFL
jgi:hypothetical protein